jgi:potassium/hydrogen antiporter
MSAALILGLVGALLILAFVANRVFRLTRIPDVVVLMGLGVLLGPGLGLFNVAVLSKATNLLGTLAIILVLFEGGLELDLRHTLRHFPGGLLLACVAFSFSVGLVALIVCKGLGLPLTTGLLVGAVLGCPSSTVVLPVLQQMEADEPVKATLTMEASLGDVLAVLAVSVLLGLKGDSGPIAISVAHGVLTQVGLALLFAVAAGILWSRLLPVLSEQHFWQVLTFSVVLVLYAGMEALGANGLIAVLGFGLTLSNFPGVDPRASPSPSAELVGSQHALLTFHSELAFLVRTFFFVLIGAVAQLGIFSRRTLLMAGTVAALFLARWLAVQASRWSWKGIGAHGRDVILWMLPRGLITIVLAIEVARVRGSEVSFLPGLAFAVILATNLMVVVGSVLTARSATAEAGVEAPVVADDKTPTDAVQPAKRSRRWILDAAMLVLLTLSGIILWYSNQPPEFRSKGLAQWILQHVQRRN